MSSFFSNLSASNLRRAAEIKEKIDALENDLNQLLQEPNSKQGRGGGRRRMSAAGRAAIGAAARARWARVKGRKTLAASKRKSGRKMSPAAKARLSAIAKARWKRAKAAGKSAL